MEVENPIVEGNIVRNLIRARVMVNVTKTLPVGCWIPTVDLPKL